MICDVNYIKRKYEEFCNNVKQGNYRSKGIIWDYKANSARYNKAIEKAYDEKRNN